jgi:monoamine oxidase
MPAFRRIGGTETVDAVVVGAGLAGLPAASELDAGGASMMVMEAEDGVGGRAMAGRVAGTTVESGERAAREVLSRTGLRPETSVSGEDDRPQGRLAQGYTHRG